MSKKVLIALFALVFSSVAFAQHDQYGEWKQDKDGSIYLKSTTSNLNSSFAQTNSIQVSAWNGEMALVLWIAGAPKEIGKGGAGDYPIVEMEMAFDNGEYGYFTFMDAMPNWKVDYHAYHYVLYDRFKKTLVVDATGFLKQMANKRILKVRYKLKNGSTETQTFNLEGLDAILELL